MPQLHLAYLNAKSPPGNPRSGSSSLATSWWPARSTSAVSRWTTSGGTPRPGSARGLHGRRVKIQWLGG
ncbi:MAG TPA: hypothetical protein VGA61_10545 [Anaerolineae bacterium]